MRRAAIGTELGTEIPEDLRTRAARTGVAHTPEVVVAEALNPFHRHADGLVPDGLGFIVTVVHRDPKAFRIESEHIGVELPRKRDRFSLEVVTEAEVPQHLEEAEVAIRSADVVQVVVLATRPHTLLARGRTRVRRRLLTVEVRDERQHSGDGEQDTLVVRDQTRARHDRMTALREVLKKGASKLVSGLGNHGRAGYPTLISFPRGVPSRGGAWRRGLRRRRP